LLEPGRSPARCSCRVEKRLNDSRTGFFSRRRACRGHARHRQLVRTGLRHGMCISTMCAKARGPRPALQGPRGLAASAQMLRPSNRSCSPAASSAGRKVHGAQLQTWPRVRVRRSPRPASGATTLSSRVVSECSVAAAATFIACVGSARADGLASDATSAHGVEVIDLEPRRRPQGRRFVLHRTCGPRFCPRWVCLLACRVPQAALTGTVASSAPIVGV
jgi:hypothetical protein